MVISIDPYFFKQLKLLDKSKPVRLVSLSEEMLLDQTLSGNDMRMLVLIAYLSNRSGFCDITNQQLEKTFPKMSGALFKYYLSKLQKRHLLFKKLIKKRSGTTRILVIQSNWKKCYKYWKKKKRVNLADELKRYFIGLPVEVCHYN